MVHRRRPIAEWGEGAVSVRPRGFDGKWLRDPQIATEPKVGFAHIAIAVRAAHCTGAQHRCQDEQARCDEPSHPLGGHANAPQVPDDEPGRRLRCHANAPQVRCGPPSQDRDRPDPPRDRIRRHDHAVRGDEGSHPHEGEHHHTHRGDEACRKAHPVRPRWRRRDEQERRDRGQRQEGPDPRGPNDDDAPAGTTYETKRPVVLP